MVPGLSQLPLSLQQLIQSLNHQGLASSKISWQGAVQQALVGTDAQAVAALLHGCRQLGTASAAAAAGAPEADPPDQPLQPVFHRRSGDWWDGDHLGPSAAPLGWGSGSYPCGRHPPAPAGSHPPATCGSHPPAQPRGKSSAYELPERL